MTNSGSKLFRMTVNMEDGNIESVEVKQGENWDLLDLDKQTDATFDRLAPILHRFRGKYVTTIHQDKSSPGCVWYWYRNRWIEVCR